MEHPRVCGENLNRKLGDRSITGTSPRMRGKPEALLPALIRVRNIPAYAGKTQPHFHRPRQAEEHPRVCGENNYSNAGLRMAEGTSPRMRGKRVRDALSMEIVGNIPAYAGKTSQASINSCCLSEHPRVCGENPKPHGNVTLVGGTSPRMRGKLVHDVLFVQLRRNIPAYAGKTREVFSLADDFQEHPRVCGENVHDHVKQHIDCGTSPRMRGKLPNQPCYHRKHRNIPAYAGKTGQAMMVWCWPQEHPRVCGENVMIAPAYMGWGGTSPRMRGKLRRRGGFPCRARNIPAYAGKTGQAMMVWCWPQEHPRVCGENHGGDVGHSFTIGTSPRMRGKPHNCSPFSQGTRNIPAYAGKTRF